LNWQGLRPVECGGEAAKNILLGLGRKNSGKVGFTGSGGNKK